jgi:hypothetical protein
MLLPLSTQNTIVISLDCPAAHALVEAYLSRGYTALTWGLFYVKLQKEA